MNNARRQKGAALLIALVVAAIAAAVATTLASDQQRWLASVEHRRDQVQGQAIALAGIQWARQVLDEDSRAGPFDHLGEPWALPLPRTPLDHGSIEGRIVDAQGLLNVNTLADTGIAGATERSRFERLFTRLGIATATLDAVADYIDTDNETRPAGAEDAYYQRAAAPYVAANAALVRSGELANVRGLSAASVARLTPWAVALPPRTPLNINTAPPEVLSAAVAGLDGDGLTALMASRAARPFTTVADFRSRLPAGASFANDTAFSVRSDYFLVTVTARQGTTLTHARALIRRGAGAWPAIVWQTVE